MKRSIFFILILVPAFSFGQNEKPNVISWSWGIGTIHRQDLIFSPIIHRDISILNLALTYERKQTLTQTVEISFSFYNPALSGKSYFEYGEENILSPHTFSFVYFYYKIGKDIFRNEKLSVNAGGYFNPDIQALNYTYGRTGPYFGYFTAFSMGIAGKAQYKINHRSHFTAEIRLPIAAWISRSPYMVNDDEFIDNTLSHDPLKTMVSFIADGEINSWNTYRQARICLKYEAQLGKRLGTGVKYEFTALNHTEPRNLSSIVNVINLIFQYHF